MKIYPLFFAVLFATAISSCKKEHKPAVNTSTSITGSWRWVKSVGGIGPNTLTPQNTGNNFTDIFYADSTYQRYKNGSLLVHGPFSIIKNYQYRDQLVTLFKAEYVNEVIHISNDTLYMYDAFNIDASADTYVRQ